MADTNDAFESLERIYAIRDRFLQGQRPRILTAILRGPLNASPWSDSSPSSPTSENTNGIVTEVSEVANGDSLARDTTTGSAAAINNVDRHADTGDPIEQQQEEDDPTIPYDYTEPVDGEE